MSAVKCPVLSGVNKNYSRSRWRVRKVNCLSICSIIVATLFLSQVTTYAQDREAGSFSVGEAHITVDVPPILVRKPSQNSTGMDCIKTNSSEISFDVGISQLSNDQSAAPETVFLLKDLRPDPLGLAGCSPDASYSYVLQSLSSRFRNSRDLSRIISKGGTFTLVLVPTL